MQHCCQPYMRVFRDRADVSHARPPTKQCWAHTPHAQSAAGGRLPSGCDAWRGVQLPAYEPPPAHQPPQTLAPTTPRAGAGGSAAPPSSPKEAESELLRTHLQVLSNYVDRCRQLSKSSLFPFKPKIYCCICESCRERPVSAAAMPCDMLRLPSSFPPSLGVCHRRAACNVKITIHKKA